MKVLVIDDELVSRKKMEKIMGTFSHCVSVDSGEIAIKVFEVAVRNRKYFDVVTLDISMPRVDGLAVLQELRKIEKTMDVPKSSRARIIMVTAHSDRDTVLLCIQSGCDSYISKPFDRAIVTQKLMDLGLKALMPVPRDNSIRNMVMETIRKFREGEISLPVLSQISRQIETVMNDPEAGLDDMVKVLEKDGTIPVNLIAVANSVAYGSADKIHDLQTAIARLGNQEVFDTVCAISNKGLYESRNIQVNGLLKSLWLNSLACAHCCREIAAYAGGKDSGKIFLMGLTHNIGCVVLLKSIGDIAANRVQFDRVELMESLNEVHTSFGAALLANWGFDEEFCESVIQHKWNRFEKETGKNILIVNLADKICSNISYGFFERDIDLSDLESAKRLRIDATVINRIGQIIREKMKSVEHVLLDVH